MRALTLEYTVGAELPDYELTWNDADGDLIDYSTGWTFELRVDTPTPTVKSTGIIGAATAPNVTVSIADGEWDDLPAPATFGAQLWAHRESDGRDRVMPLRLAVLAAIPTT